MFDDNSPHAVKKTLRHHRSEAGARCYHSTGTHHYPRMAVHRICSLRFSRKFAARLGLAAALCAALLPAAYASQKPAAKPAVFPHLTAYNLSKTKLDLPGDFAGQLNLLLISFRPEQQSQIDSWMPVAQALQHIHSGFHWYQLPVSDSENFIFRWWDNSSMRSDDTDPETWPWIVPLYVNRHHFRRSLQIPTGKQVSVLLVNQQGRVLWRSEGPMTMEKRDSLKAKVAATTADQP
jgi:hypothetical protein